jgi:hypothetical protein
MKATHEWRWGTWTVGLTPALLTGLLTACGGGGEGLVGDEQPVVLTHPVSVTVTGGGKVTSVSGIDCGSTCSTNLPVNTSITLVAVPNAGQRLQFKVTESGLVHQVNAIAANGDAMVIWQQPDGQPNGSVSKVYSRLYIAGQGWQPAVQVPGMSDFANRQQRGDGRFRQHPCADQRQRRLQPDAARRRLVA